tara:strand:+ start:1198 stop:1593 length:396 start_codon:yes stop_codon:yes gene_type:complete
MKALIIESKRDTPKIHFDKENNKYEISGCSLPEDSNAFYTPVIDWLSDFSESPASSFNFEFKLDYFNTSSSKVFLDILTILEKIKQSGSQVEIKWYFDEDDEDMEMAGEEYDNLIEIPFELIPVEVEDEDF